MANASEELRQIKAQQGELAQRHQATREKLNRLHAALADVRAQHIEITDHAIVRYAERVLGLNVEEVKLAIAAKAAPMAFTLGDGSYPVGHGCVAVVKNKTVVTVKPA